MLHGVLFSMLILCVISDIRSSKIRNIYVLPAVLIGLVTNVYFYGFTGLKLSVMGIVLPLLILGIFFYARLIGAGDLKLFAAMGALLGWSFVLYSMAYSFIFAGIFAFISLARRAEIRSAFSDFYQEVRTCILTGNLVYLQISSKKHVIRLSPTIAMGVCLQLLLCSF